MLNLLFFFQMPALNREEKVKNVDCGKEYSRANAARHRKTSVRGFISRPVCNYCTYNQQEMNFHTIKKHLKSTPTSTKLCIVWERTPKLLFTSRTSQERSRVESEEKEWFCCWLEWNLGIRNTFKEFRSVICQ